MATRQREKGQRDRKDRTERRKDRGSREKEEKTGVGVGEREVGWAGKIRGKEVWARETRKGAWAGKKE